MTGFDYVVLLVVGVGAIGGFWRGFLQEALQLAAWMVAVVAVRLFHEPLTDILALRLPTSTGAGVLAFALLTIVPYLVIRIVASQIGNASRASPLGPIDRLLGFGFGAAKGAVIVVLGFSVVVFGYDVVWGAKGRPPWITQARVYPMLDAASDEVMTLISERRAEARKGAKKKRGLVPPVEEDAN